MNAKRVVILQPHFLPFIGFFDLMQRADLFVYYDTAQFVDRSWHCRTYIQEGGVARWLSLPISRRGGSRCQMREMELDSSSLWRDKVCRRLQETYAATQERGLLEAITTLVQAGPSNVCAWNIRAAQALGSSLALSVPWVRASDLGPVGGDKLERLINICRLVGATHYVCGPGSRFYVRDEAFAAVGIGIEWVSYNYRYKVVLPSGEAIYPSALDLLLRKGREYAREELRSENGRPDTPLQSAPGAGTLR